MGHAGPDGVAHGSPKEALASMEVLMEDLRGSCQLSSTIPGLCGLLPGLRGVLSVLSDIYRYRLLYAYTERLWIQYIPSSFFAGTANASPKKADSERDMPNQKRLTLRKASGIRGAGWEDPRQA